MEIDRVVVRGRVGRRRFRSVRSRYLAVVARQFADGDDSGAVRRFVGRLRVATSRLAAASAAADDADHDSHQQDDDSRRNTDHQSHEQAVEPGGLCSNKRQKLISALVPSARRHIPVRIWCTSQIFTILLLKFNGEHRSTLTARISWRSFP